MLSNRFFAPGRAIVAAMLVCGGIFIAMAQDASEEADVLISEHYRLGSARFKQQARELAEKFQRETVAEAFLRRNPGMTLADQPEPELGMQTEFFVDRNGGDKRVKVPATLKIIGVHCLVYLEKGRRVDENKLKRMAQIFDRTVYPKTTSNFGSEWKPGIDGDPRITLLLLSGMEDCDGYFYPGDEFTEDKHPGSNQREMLYLSINRLKDVDDFMEHLVAHELQHMIHWFHDDKETYWVEEGLSEYAATLFNRVPWTAEQYFARPDRNLLDWEDDQDSENYGHSFLFTDYLFNRPELSETARQKLSRELVKSKATGIRGIDAALSKVTRKIDFLAVFRDFCVATHLHHCAGGKHPYSFSPVVKRAFKKYKQNRVLPRKNFSGQKGTVKGKVSMWSSAAFEFALPASKSQLQLQFSGQTVASAKNSFWIAMVLTDAAGRQVPEVRWRKTQANSLKTAIDIPAGSHDRLLILVCNQGPENYKDGDGRLPKAEFAFSVNPANFAEVHGEGR
ncbi:MAG: hypothetical protein ACOYXC_11955 [Candidatus Rifleibacteriota bacterium]